MPPWHPNLRIADRLPDTKVIRTAFFVNGAAIVVAMALGLYMGIQEWQNHSLNVQIADWQRSIDTHRRTSEQAVALFGKFQAESARVAEVDAFLKSRAAVSPIILRLGQTMPKKIALDGLELRETGMTIRGTVRGSPDQASGDVSSYLEQLRHDPIFGTLFEDVSLTNLSRNNQSGRLMIEISLPFRKGSSPAKKT